ncbi:MAG TPA: hypothetical protein VF223_00670 [Trebonia sp.]
MRMIPLTNLEKPPCIGLNHSHAGVMEPAGWFPVPTRISAVREKTSSMTSTSEATIAQPPAQPVRGPKARAPHVNVVPQSGSDLFSSL